MEYFRIRWNEKLKTHERKEIKQEEATKVLKEYYKDISFIGRYQFRLRTPDGWIQTMTEDGFTPLPGFFGVCGDWAPSED